MEVENQLSFMQEELDAQHEERVEVLLSVCLCLFGWNCCRCEKNWISKPCSSQLFLRCAGYVQEYRVRCASTLFVLVIQELARAKRSVAEYQKEAMQALQSTGWFVGLYCITLSNAVLLRILRTLHALLQFHRFGLTGASKALEYDFCVFSIDMSLAAASDKHVSLEAALCALKNSPGPARVAMLAERVKEAAERHGL